MDRETKLDIIELSRGYLGVLLMTILMWTGVVSAYYPGETIEIPNEMEIDNLVYTIIENTTEISPLNVSINSTNITIGFPQDMPPNNFKIVFLEEQTKEVVQVIHSGGGSRTKYIDRNVTVEVPTIVEKEIIKEIPRSKEQTFLDLLDSPVEVVEVTEEGFKTWHIIFAMVCGMIFSWIIFKRLEVQNE